MDGERCIEIQAHLSFAKRWNWVKTLREPMLFLPGDYEIYSLGLLKYQVRHMNVHLEEQPTGCLARLNTSCQDNALGETLLGNVTNVTKVSSDNHLHQKDFVCKTHVGNSTSGTLSMTSWFLDREWNYLCCSVQNFAEKNDSLIRCGIPVEGDWFLASLHVVLIILTTIVLLYSPAIPLLLPDFLFNLQYECENEKEEEQQIRNKQKSEIEKRVELEEDPDKEDNKEENNIELVNTGLENDTHEENSQVLPCQPHQQEIYIEHRVESEEERDEEDSYSLELNFPVRDDQGTSDREIPLDDASPITFCALLGGYAKELPHIKINFNLRLLFLCFVVFPFFSYLKIAVTLFHKFRYYQETCQKLPMVSFRQTKEVVAWSWACLFMKFYSWRAKDTLLNIILITCCVNLFVFLLFIRPKDFIEQIPYVSVCSESCSQSVSISQKILRHLNEQREWVYDFTFFILNHYMKTLKRCLKKLTPSRTTLRLRESRGRRAFRSLRVSISVFPGLLIVAALGIFYIMIFLITLGFKILISSPTITSVFFFGSKLLMLFYNSTNSIVISFLFAFMYFTLFYILFIIVAFISITFITQTFLLTSMGLVLNAEFVTPYAAFILVVTRNMYLCYSNLQSRYKEVKGLISKHWQQETKELPWINCSNNDTIPKELFWFVCGNNGKKNTFCLAPDESNDNEFDSQEQVAFPLRTEMCYMLREITLILLFLSLSLFIILSFKTTNDISALVSTIFVFISGAIPSLILGGFAKKRETFSGWNKIRIEKKIKKAVKEYIAEMELRHSEGLGLNSIQGSVTDLEMNR